MKLLTRIFIGLLFGYLVIGFLTLLLFAGGLIKYLVQ